MIRRNEYGLSPRFEIAIDNAEVDYLALNEIEVNVEENMHDMLVLHMAGLPTRASADYRNKGVKLHLDTGTTYAHDFAGYVIDVRPESKTAQGLLNGSPFQDVQIVCLGASYAMRGSKSEVWDGFRLQDIAIEMASRYGFSVDVPHDPVIKSPLVQEEESDWQFLVKVCKQYGYSVNVHGTHMHIYDPHKAAGRAVSYNKLFTAKDTNSLAKAAPGQITSLKASLAEHHADGLYKDTVVTVQSGDITFDVTTSELKGLTDKARFQDRLSEHATTFAEAERIIATHSKDHYDFEAGVQVMGLAGCYPGGVVNIDKYVSEVDGLWYVNGLCHSLTSGVFMSTLKLKKNITNELNSVQSVQAFQTPPPSRLTNGVWTATSRRVNVY